MREKTRMGAAPRPKPTTIDAYLDGLEPEKRAALSRLRRQIHAAAPGLTEQIRYGLPAFRHQGRPLIYMGATPKHCAVYGAVGEMGDALAGYDVSKGTIRFDAARPLPAALVRKIVKMRLSRLVQGAGRPLRK